MTAPVVQEPAGAEKIAMTAPVVQDEREQPGGYLVAVRDAGRLHRRHRCPSRPIPGSPIRESPRSSPRRCGSPAGGRSRRSVERATALGRAVTAAGLQPTGAIRYARFDPPWKPWFLRRNEVVLPVVE